MPEPSSPAPETHTHEELPGTTPFCLATIVVDRALESLLASGAQGQIKDEHPWLVAQRAFQEASELSLRVPLLLATQCPDPVDQGLAPDQQTDSACSAPAAGDVHDCAFSHWGFIRSIDVLELSGKRYQTTIGLGSLLEVSPLFTAIDAVNLKPSDEQLMREEVEAVRTQRVPLREQYMRPYAFCESPGFIPRLTPWHYD